jgi:6-pyruvoyltetrahydropterin/6-carboxytetrahydropterin synthase
MRAPIEWSGVGSRQTAGPSWAPVVHNGERRWRRRGGGDMTTSGVVFEVTKTGGFDSAHRLPDGPGDSPYVRLHGHSFRVEVTLRGPAVPPIGWVMDLGELDAALTVVCSELDHTLLNEHPGLESPTLEALCAFFAERLSSAFPSLAKVVVSRPTIGESCALVVA